MSKKRPQQQPSTSYQSDDLYDDDYDPQLDDLFNYEEEEVVAQGSAPGAPPTGKVREFYSKYWKNQKKLKKKYWKCQENLSANNTLYLLIISVQPIICLLQDTVSAYKLNGWIPDTICGTFLQQCQTTILRQQ